MQQRQQTGGRGKAYIFLGVSLIAAVLAVVLVIQLLKQADKRVKEATQEKETVDVVVATRNLYMGLPITEDDVAVRELAPEMVPADVVFTSSDMVIGRTPKERILAQEIVRTERLARKESGVGLNAVITPGYRAVAVAVKAEEAVAGFIQPLNYVDVIVVIKPDDTKEVGSRAVSKTILQGIKVLAVGDSMQGNYGNEAEPVDTKKKKKSSGNKGVVKGKRTITLEVAPEEAEALALAQAKGDIVLALRADIDINQIETHGQRVDTLIGLDPEEKPPEPMAARPRGNGTKKPPADDGPTAVVIEGGNTTEVTFNNDGTTDESSENQRRKRR